MKRKELIKYNHWLWKQRFGEMVQTIGMDGIADKYLSTLPNEDSQFLDDIKKEDNRGYNLSKNETDLPLPDEKEDEINPYLLTGEELEKAVERRKSNQP